MSSVFQDNEELYEKKIEELTQQNRFKTKEIEKSLFKITELEDKLDTATSENSSLKKEVDRLNELLSQSSSKFRTINTNFLEREKTYTTKESELVRQLSDSEHKTEVLESTVKNLTTQVELDNKEIASLKQKIQDYELIIEEHSKECLIKQFERPSQVDQT